MSDFGTRLRTLRKEKGITQLALSQSLHVAQESISSYEHKGSIPSIEILISLAEFFDVSVDYLLGIDTKRKRISVQELDSF